MSQNPYAPPTADVDLPATSPGEAPLFYSVSTLKYVVMSVCTLRLYEVYWFYMNWQLVKRRDRSNIWPVPRALFAIFFCYQLLDRMRRDGAANEVANAPALDWLAIGWIVLSLCWKLPAPYYLISLLALFTLAPAQGYANRINAKVVPGHRPNRRFTLLNCVGVLLGGAFLILAIIGSFDPRLQEGS